MSPRRNLRLRLTLHYAGLFLVGSAVLVGAAYFLVRHNVGPVRAIIKESGGTTALIPHRQLDHDAWRRTIAQLALVFGALATASIVVAWIIAGRALRPLNRIIETTRRISEANLGERIALHGPPDELQRLADGLDDMLERLGGVVASQRRFIADASHELRTPLAVMRAGIDLSLTDPAASEEERRAATETLIESIQRSESLIKSMLALARSEAAVDERLDLDLAEIAAEMLGEVTEAIDERGLSLETDLNLAVVRGDPALLRTLVLNLLRNAVAYNRPRGSIRIEVAVEGDSGVLRVVNTGEVVLDDEAEGLFEPFRRSRASRSTGVGLGLAIVKSVTVRHGGHVSARAVDAGGLDVEVSLPLARRGGSAPPNFPTSARARRPRRLDGSLRMLLLASASILAGYAAFNGAIAVARVPIVHTSGEQARRGAIAFPLVWAGMSEENVRRVAGPPTWAGQNGLCRTRQRGPRGGIAMLPCDRGSRCLQYGDVDSSDSTEFCFEGGLAFKRRWTGSAWMTVISEGVR